MVEGRALFATDFGAEGGFAMFFVIGCLCLLRRAAADVSRGICVVCLVVYVYIEEDTIQFAAFGNISRSNTSCCFDYVYFNANC